MNATIFRIAFAAILLTAYEPSYARGESAKVRWARPTGLTEFYCTASSGLPVVAGRGGLCALFDLDRVSFVTSQLPTASTIVAVEPSRMGLVAVTKDNQIFRQNNNWDLLYSAFNTKDICLSKDHYIVYHDKTVDVYSIHTDALQMSIDSASVAPTSLFSVSDSLLTIGYADGRVAIVNSNSHDVVDDSVGSFVIRAFFIDATGVRYSSDDRGVFRRTDAASEWTAFMPPAVGSRAVMGRKHFIRHSKMYFQQDSTYWSISVHDSGGARMYNALVRWHNQEPLDSAVVCYMASEFPDGAGLFVGHTNQLLRITGTPGFFMVSSGSNGADVEWRSVFAEEYMVHYEGWPSLGHDGALYWVVSSDNNREKQSQYRTIISNIRNDTEIVRDTIQSLGCKGDKRKAEAVIASADEAVLSFTSYDTLAVLDSKGNTRNCELGINFSKVWRSGNTIIATNLFKFQVSEDGGQTWNFPSLSLAGKLRSGHVLNDSAFACQYYNGPNSTAIVTTTDRGRSWVQREISGAWRSIIGNDGSKIYMLPEAGGVLTDNIRIALLEYDIVSGEEHVLVDSILAVKGHIVGGFMLNGICYAMTSGSAGIVRFSGNRQSIIVDTLSAFRCPSEETHGDFIVANGKAYYKSGYGTLVIYDQDASVVVEDNLMHIGVSDVWPVPAINQIKVRITLPFREDFAYAKAGIYDLTGQLVVNLTNELQRGAYDNVNVEFEKGGIDLPNGAYIVVAQTGPHVASKNILVYR